MSFVEVEPDVRIFYRDLGDRDAPPVVLLHGWTLTHQAWDHQIVTLMADHRVVVPDLRGHGQSDKPAGGYDPERIAADIEAMMDALDLQDVSLIGWSFGGTTATRVASRHGDRLARLGLINAAGPKYLADESWEHGHSEETLKEWQRSEGDELATWRKGVVEAMPREPYEELFTRWLWVQSMQCPSWAAAPMLDTYARVDLRPELEDIRVPTCIFHGVHDVYCSLEGAKLFTDGIDDARLVEFTNSGHSPHYEERDRFDSELAEFLAG